MKSYCWLFGGVKRLWVSIGTEGAYIISMEAVTSLGNMSSLLFHFLIGNLFKDMFSMFSLLFLVLPLSIGM